MQRAASGTDEQPPISNVTDTHSLIYLFACSLRFIAISFSVGSFCVRHCCPCAQLPQAYDMHATWLQRALFSAVGPLLDKGYLHALEHTDLYQVGCSVSAPAYSDFFFLTIIHIRPMSRHSRRSFFHRFDPIKNLI